MSKYSAMITGATSGIGEATAHLLAPHCQQLILNGRREERLQAMQKELSAQHKCEILLAPFDVRDREALLAWFDKEQKSLQNIDVLVNNAGLARGTEPLHKGVWEDWEEMIDTNVRGLLAMTRQIVPTMVSNKRGHVINLGSVAGRWTYPGGGVYCATKYSVRALTEALRMDLIGTGVRVTNIEPGMVETEFSQVRFRDNDKAQQVYKNMHPLSAQDIAETILWSLQRPRHVNIQEIVIFPTDQAAIRDVHRGNP